MSLIIVAVESIAANDPGLGEGVEFIERPAR